MRQAAIRIVLVCLVSSFLATGCWNRRELNTLAIQLGTGIDKVGDKYRVSVQVVDPGEVAAAKGGTSSRAPVVMYKATGTTLFEAFRRMTLNSPRKIYSAHIRVLVIGESLAREGIDKVLDFLSRDAEMRTDFDIFVAKGTRAEDVLRVMTPLEKIPANKLFDSLRASEAAWAPTTSFTLDQLISQLVASGQDPVLTGVVVEGERKGGESFSNIRQIDPPVRLKLSTLAVFFGPKMVGWLTEDESKGYNTIMGNLKSTVTNLSCPDGGTLSLEIIRSKAKIKGFADNGRPAVRVDVLTQANVGEVDCLIDLDDPRTIDRLEDLAEEKGVRLMTKAVEAAQQRYRADIFGFGEAINRGAPRYWQSVEKEWNELFSSTKVEYKLEFRIRGTGTTGNSFIGDIQG